MEKDDNLDKTSLFGGMRRMIKSTTAVGGIAARLAGEKMGIPINKSAHAEELKSILGGLKGPMMKVAQLISTIPNVLPDEYAKELAQLQSNAPPMGWSFVRRRMKSELGPNWESRFKNFSHEAAAAASLGQVHRAALHDGREVACKLQYPDMASTVESDLKQLRLLITVYHRLDNAIKQDEVYKELVTRLQEELDYEREAANLRLFSLMLQDSSRTIVPDLIEDLSTKRLLTMEWVEGKSLQHMINSGLDQARKNDIARSLFFSWYIPFYHYGVIHGDPHMGNFLINPDNRLCLLDFGSIRIFQGKFVQGVIDLCKAIETHDDELAHHAYTSWGFKDISKETMEILNEWARFLYAPLTQDKERLIQDDSDPDLGRKIAAKVHKGLQKAGGVTPPREFVLVDRSAIGLGSLFTRLNAKLNWHHMFQEMIANFNQETMDRAQKQALETARVPPPLE
ncbi:ABC1 kinase family protein [Commensalibacter oyaizuii]|uniref:AarF/ABC1/UbiB kinase family protein n=1 Tax=Commensalibacter oyaizuii TaxID=3043873 RepID=A0ABT6PZ26_9PROT|nr:AarF/ABC1/UbiB kinase family protein [Commensalibacter sp. TBRC 16381]MDI2089988.1 AarF/ABC1/UbiB kinase family protein [Commensalibacter sp. TBRC 16381]